ncbi:hypothetical protein CSUNSWCD_296 [Campylobacter showae CSUNSWCD]|uniref:Uncharacterized protein n=1 Tax=Campylobacter showae CSUNSWCD TaxID=1244083 RepID=M5ISB9_9BACT|nr:hypothetical protein CSUNSWCD_296 [Campylobacter showae CSUNSWCD]
MIHGFGCVAASNLTQILQAFASIKIISSKRRGKSSNLKLNLSSASKSGLPKKQAKRGIFMICSVEIV